MLTVLVLLVQHGVATAVQRLGDERRLQDLIPCSRVAFSPRVAISMGIGSPRFVVGADLDNDGDVDVISAAEDGGVNWHENDGTAKFTTRTIDPNADGAWAVAVGDMNGDGLLDIVAALSNLDQIAWYKGDVHGTFTKQIVVPFGAYAAVSVAVADLDNDGDLDIAAALWGADAFVWYENSGFATFTQRVIDNNADLARAVVIADVDGDHRLDIVTGSGGDDTIAYYKNNARMNGITFEKRVITTTADGPRGVAVGDLDGDNDIDVLSASVEDDILAYYENNGHPTPTFTKRIIAQDRDGVWSVNVADLDGDMDLDVLAASANDDIVEWFENDGGGSFMDILISRTTDYAYHVDAADLDGDLDLDVMTAAVNDDIIGWHENVCLSQPSAPPLGPPTPRPTSVVTPPPSNGASYVPTTSFPSLRPTIMPTYAPTVSRAPTTLVVPDQSLPLPSGYGVSSSKKKTTESETSSASFAISIAAGSIILLLLLIIGSLVCMRLRRGEPVTAFVVSPETYGVEMK